MKKVLSVLLAAAMVAGMSVTSFAKVWGAPADAGEAPAGFTVEDIAFGRNMYITHEDKTGDRVHVSVKEDEHTIIAGDTLYFDLGYYADVNEWVPANDATADAYEAGKVTKPSIKIEEEYFGYAHPFMGNGTWAKDGAYRWEPKTVSKWFAYDYEVDASWLINMKDVAYVESATFTAWDHINNVYDAKLVDEEGYDKCVAVKVEADYDAISEDEIDFYFYIAEKDEDTHETLKSEMVEVHYLFDNWDEEQNSEFVVNFKFENEVDVPAKWSVAEGDKGVATFSFDDKAFFETKMVSEEEVVLNAEIKSYVAAIEKAFDYEAEYVSYNFKGTKDSFYKEGVLLLPADEDTFIYAWDGEEFVEIEAEYVEDYKFQTGKKVDGWKVETNDLDWYVVSDTEAVIEAAEEVETEVEAEKANPETGAADFVGAAVAMAVVSVAAAGALALKK